VAPAPPKGLDRTIDQPGRDKGEGKAKAKAKDPARVKDKAKGKGKEKKARKALEAQARVLSKSADKGGDKQARLSRLLADELFPVRAALAAMEGRVADLHGRIHTREQSDSAAADRAAALADAVAAAQSSGAALGRRVEDLAALLEGLMEAERRRPAHDPGPIEALRSRLAGIETALDQAAEERRRDRGTGPSAAVLAGRLAALGATLESQGQRLTEVERGLTETRAMPAALGDRWRAELLALRAELDVRLDGLGDEIDRARARSREELETGQVSTEHKMRRLSRGLALGLLTLGLLTLGLAGANWWRGEQAAGRAAEHIGALEQGPAIAALAPAGSVRAPGMGSGELAGPELADTLTQTLTRLSGQLERMETAPAAAAAPESAVVMDDLLERLRRAEDRLADAAGALSERRASGVALERQVADLAGAQRALDARVDVLDPASGVSVPAAVEPPLPALSPVVASALAPQVQGLIDTAYGVQLVVYTSPGRLQPFAERHGLGGRAVVVETRVHGRDGYAVLTGPFASEDAARAALADLPAGLRELDPWVRRLPAGTRLLPLE
jgi:septal ring-binding cell division protein DamX